MTISQSSIPVVANILSTIGTIFWCVQLVPQIWHMYRSKSSEGVPPSMMLLWNASAVPFGAYNKIQNFAITLVVQPQMFGTLGLVVWGQCMYYGRGWSRWKASLTVLVSWALLGGLEALLILTLTPVYDSGVEWPVTLIGVVAAMVLAGGFIPAIVDIFRKGGRVVGLSFIFLAIDCMGAFFSIMGVVTQGKFDILGGVLYIICASIEIGIFVSHGIWLIRTRHLRRLAERQETVFDNFPGTKRYRWPCDTNGQEVLKKEPSVTVIETPGDVRV